MEFNLLLNCRYNQQETNFMELSITSTHCSSLFITKYVKVSLDAKIKFSTGIDCSSDQNKLRLRSFDYLQVDFITKVFRLMYFCFVIASIHLFKMRHFWMNALAFIWTIKLSHINRITKTLQQTIQKIKKTKQLSIRILLKCTSNHSEIKVQLCLKKNNVSKDLFL